MLLSESSHVQCLTASSLATPLPRITTTILETAPELEGQTHYPLAVARLLHVSRSECCFNCGLSGMSFAILLQVMSPFKLCLSVAELWLLYEDCRAIVSNALQAMRCCIDLWSPYQCFIKWHPPRHKYKASFTLTSPLQ